MDRGFTAIRERLASGAIPTDAGGTLLVEAGRTILGTVGGASGALYGRALMRAGVRVTDLRSNGDATTVASAVFEGLVAATQAIAALGRSSVGDKTMLDALVPAQTALRAAIDAARPDAEALSAAVAAAEDGARATVPLVAKKGRASYLGERSAGHLDPGAASSALLIRALAEAAASTGKS
jgi:dihydroxyacetone kinase-like protein